MEPLASVARSVVAAAIVAAVTADAARAQTPAAGTYDSSPRRLTFGGEISGILGPDDDVAFFNYTDYESNALRTIRIRLFGEWRVARPVSIVGELRTEAGTGIEAAALFVRWQPWETREISIQAGRIPPVVGAFARRAYGRDNAVIGLPLAYQYLISLRPDALPATVDDVLRMRGRGWQLSYPIGEQTLEPGIALISASRWDTGAEVHWQHGIVEASAAVTRGAPAVPVVRDAPNRPGWSGRVAVQTPIGLTLAGSAARGHWIEDGAIALVPAPKRREAMQTLLAADGEYSHGPLLLRGEWLHSTFEVPFAALPDPGPSLAAWSAFIEARYRLHPRWQVGTRVERLDFGAVTRASAPTTPVAWDAPVDRVEVAVGFRVARFFDIRAAVQHNWRDGGRVRSRTFPALQVIFGF
jgi:hypothetical protein